MVLYIPRDQSRSICERYSLRDACVDFACCAVLTELGSISSISKQIKTLARIAYNLFILPREYKPVKLVFNFLTLFPSFDRVYVSESPGARTQVKKKGGS